MSQECNALARRVFEEMWNQKNPALITEIIDARHRYHTPSGLFHGEEGYRQLYDTFSGAFPDLHFVIEEQITEGDTVVTRYTARGTQTGEFAGIPASGKAVEVPGITIFRLGGGKVVESMVLWDTLALMQQIGAVPSPQPTGVGG